MMTKLSKYMLESVWLEIICNWSERSEQKRENEIVIYYAFEDNSSAIVHLSVSYSVSAITLFASTGNPINYLYC